MKIEQVNDYSDLLKINNSYVINNNNTEYQKAIQKKTFLNDVKNSVDKIQSIESRLGALENDISSILEIIKGSYGNNNSPTN